MTIVSYSEIVKKQTCDRQYYYRFILGLAPTEESDAITTGIKGHKLLQDFYNLLREGMSKEEALEHTTQKAKRVIKEESFTNLKALLTAWTLVDNYIRETDFTAEPILVENRFLLPVPAISDDPEMSHVQIGFTPDAAFQRKGGFIDVEDAKFVQRAWSKSKLNRFSQLKLYQIFLSRMGYDASRTRIRFFNTTTGKISTQPYVLKEDEERILIRDFMYGVRDVVRYKEGPPHTLELAPRTMNNSACQFCSFEFPCTLEAEGKDASNTLKNLYVKSDYDYIR